MRLRSFITAALSLAAYGVVFGILARPWLAVADTAQPENSMSLQRDARLITFVLTWVARTLWTSPSSLFDMPIFSPAPAQLTDSEHFLSAQILFAPLLALTEHPVLAANWTAFLLYPLGAFAMERLARQLGAGGAAAWLAGLIFALGPLRVPANLQTIQYPNVCLPLAYGAVAAFGARPSWIRAFGVTLAVTIGLFSSYYLASMVALVVAVAFFMEIGVRRWRDAVGLGAATFGAVALLVVMSMPYLGRPDAAVIATAARTTAIVASVGVLLPLSAVPFGAVELALSGIGCLALAGADDRRRRFVIAGLVFSVLGIALALGPVGKIGDVEVPLPFAALALGPTSFFRVPFRFMVLAGFGTAILTACAFDFLVARRGTLSRSLLFGVLAAIILMTRGAELVGPPFTTIAATDIPERFEEVGRLVRTSGGGAVLELPANDLTGDLDADAMVHALWHRAPVVTGFSGYMPPHRPFLRQAIARLPAADALAELIAATHVQWIVLKPAAVWMRPEARAKMLVGLRASRMVEAPVTVGDWTLLHIAARPTHPSWFETIRSGSPSGRTVLGAPLVRLPPGESPVLLTLRGRLPTLPATGSSMRLALTMVNAGTTALPVSLPPYGSSDLTVGVVATWIADPGDGTASGRRVAAAEYIPLPRDVDAGETILLDPALTAPAPGRYMLEVALTQGQPGATDGPTFGQPLRLPITVVAPPPPRAGDDATPSRAPAYCAEPVLTVLCTEPSREASAQP